jgi:hypothetical protein
MFYNGNVKTHVLEPVHMTSKRCEFRVDKKGLFMSNWRLCDVGITLNTATADVLFNFVVGGMPVKNMYLYDGKVELSKLTQAKDWVAWLNRNRDNEECTNMKVLDGTNLGYTVATPILNPAINITSIMYPNSNKAIRVSDDETPKCYFVLSKFLPLLNAVKFLHTDIFTDLRLVIEFDYSDATADTNIPVSATTPKLVIDEVLNEQVAAQQKRDFFKTPIIWNEIESEKFVVQAPTGVSGNNQTQKVSLRSTGFKNKTLGRILLQKHSQNVNNEFFRKQYSQSYVNEVEQIRVNGRDVIPDSGVDSSAYRVGITTDTWGNYCCSASSNQLGLINHFVDEYDALGLANTTNYFGMQIGEKIDYLQLNFNRDFKNTYDVATPNVKSGLNDAIELLLFGECAKAMIPDKFTGYQIVYV